MPVLNEATKVYLGDKLIYQKQPKATAVYYKPQGVGSWNQVTVSWSTNHYTCAPATQAGFIVACTTGQEPDANMTNVTALFQWTAGTTFGIVASVAFSDSGTHGDAPIQISL